MKIMSVEAKKKQADFDIDSLNFDVLPEKIFLTYSIQYKNLAEKIKNKLQEKGKKVIDFKQVLGCSRLKSKVPILLVGSGQFHALQLALQNNQVYILEEKIRKLEEKEISKIKAKRKSALSRFLSAEKIGILVSLKPGQEKFKEAIILKKKLEKKGKEVKIFLADNININELEDYNIESWVNTACPALPLDYADNRIVNVKEIED